MFAATVLSLALVAQAGPIPERRVITTEVVACDDCGVRLSAVEATVACLTASPRGEERETAARALRRVKWQCHPEVVTVLSEALRRDPDWRVREESAVSLASLNACDPEAHEALARAATRDPKLCVRLKARKGLKAIAMRCEGPCDVCDGSTPVVVGPVRRLGPVRGLIPSIDINVPGAQLHFGPRRPMIFGPPVVVEPPIVMGPSPPIGPDLGPVPRDDDTPPPRPEPSPFLAPLPDPLPAPAEPPVRRSSAKPATPPVSRPSAPSPKPASPGQEPPPLVGPSGSP